MKVEHQKLFYKTENSLQYRLNIKGKNKVYKERGTCFRSILLSKRIKVRLLLYHLFSLLSYLVLGKIQKHVTFL